MKSNKFILLFCIALFFLISGCDGDEEPPVPEQKASVKKPIIRTLPEKSPAVEPSPDSGGDLKPEAVKGIETAISKETETIRQGASDEVKAAKKEEAEGVYLTVKGDTLSIIAGRDNVMGDPLKWPLLYRLNIEQIKDTAGVDLPHSQLAEGIKLKLITGEQLKKNLKAMPENLWVINIVSSTTEEKINPVAVKLIREGYYVYITTANVKGQDWMRLRAGFFQDRNVTDIKGKMIKDLLNISDIWTTKIKADEFREYAGYLSDTGKP